MGSGWVCSLHSTAAWEAVPVQVPTPIVEGDGAFSFHIPLPNPKGPIRAFLDRVREVLSSHVAVPAMGEWLQHVRNLGPAHGGDATGPELIAAARAEDDELVGR